MTDLTTPGEIGAATDNKSTAHAISKAGGHNGYVVDGTDISAFYPELDSTNINAFAEVSQSGRDITFDGGEAFVAGWLCRDLRTTLTMPASETNTVYVGYNPDSVLGEGESPTDNNNIILGPSERFTADDPKLPLYEITTTSTSIDTVTDLRPMSRTQANGPWRNVDDAVGTVPGPLTVEDDTFRNHISIHRPDVGEWSFSATTSYGNALEIREITGTSNGTLHLTPDGHVHLDPSDTWAVESPNQSTIYTQNTDPTDDHNVEVGDIWIRTN